MGAKDLYLLQIIQYSSDENEKKPSHWAFFIHYTDKAGNLKGEGEVHEVVASQTGPRYLQRFSKFLIPTFRGACTLGLFYKKNLYKILEELETGSSKLKALGNTDSKKIPQVWVEDRLEAMRRAGVVVQGPKFSDLARSAYQSWRVHRDERQQRQQSTLSSAPSSPSIDHSRKPELSASANLESAAEVIKRHYSYPFTLYAAPY
ncbi:hypothetical protein FRC17_003741 [Serendipita sp. 399]|nr:hypothetical protein FRC17_003741 [Serendipita sp. 399]